MRGLAFACLILVATTARAGNTSSEGVTAYVRQTLHISSYRRADADLNGDGHKEIFVYVTDQDYCGSGGCNLYVLSPQRSSFRVVLRSTITWPPIRVLSTSTHGWRDIGVTVAGGGINPAYVARLRFDGHRYPSNPSVPPAIPIKRPSGRVLINR